MKSQIPNPKSQIPNPKSEIKKIDYQKLVILVGGLILPLILFTTSAEAKFRPNKDLYPKGCQNGCNDKGQSSRRKDTRNILDTWGISPRESEKQLKTTRKSQISKSR